MIKKIIITILTITLLLPINCYSQEVNANTKFNIKGYRHSEASLIEWTKVPGATWYKIYRATMKTKKHKKGKYTKFKKIGTVTENWFTKYGDNIYETRWFVNVCFFNKNGPQKGCWYNQKKNYKYKVFAYKGKNVIAKSNVIKIKKYKSKSYEIRYEDLYYANKLRYAHKKRVLPWGHQYNKAMLGRAKDIRFREKRGDDFDAKKDGHYIYHMRPKGKMEDLFKYLYMVSDEDLTISTLDRTYGENIQMGSNYARDVMDSYMHSKGHREYLLSDKNEYTYFCAYKLSVKEYFDVMKLPSVKTIVFKKSQIKTFKFNKYKKILFQILNYIQTKKNNGYFDIPSGLGLHSTQYTRMKSAYPLITNQIKNKYYSGVYDKYYTYDIFTGVYYVPEDNSGNKSYIDQEYINLLKEYVGVLINR